ncbi:MAG: FIST C-terminal domain-containing protein [Acidimicrobiales bacterium]
MPFAAALSEHPVTAFAVGEACGQVLEAIGGHPDVVAVFVTLAHAGALEDTVSTIREILHPTVIVGAASESIVGTGREVEGGPGVSVWAGRWGPVIPFRIPGGAPSVGLPLQLGFEPSALVLMGDPFSVEVEELLADLAASHPGLPVIGGMASGARGPGGTRLALDGAVHTDGAVGFVLGPGVDVVPVVSQGCRPIGRPFVVTDGEGKIVRALGGRTALERLDELAATLTPDEVRAVNAGGLYLGRVFDERKADFGPGDFLVRTVLGGDRDTGAVAIDDDVAVGTTVPFHIRDAEAAHDDLDGLLVRDAPSAEAEAVLLFTCNGRGLRLFGEPDHDAELVADRVGSVPTAGMFSAGELGPLAGRNEAHSFTASLLLLREHR